MNMKSGTSSDEHPVLRVRQVDGQRVAGRAQVDQACPVDVVVGAQPHLCSAAYSKIRSIR